MGKAKKSGKPVHGKKGSEPTESAYGGFLGGAIARSLAGGPVVTEHPQEDWEATERFVRMRRLPGEVQHLQSEVELLKARQGSASSPKLQEFTHSLDYRSVTVRGKTYSLTPRQAHMVEQLHEAYESGNPEISSDLILVELGGSNERWQDIFKRNLIAKLELWSRARQAPANT